MSYFFRSTLICFSMSIIFCKSSSWFLSGLKLLVLFRVLSSETTFRRMSAIYNSSLSVLLCEFDNCVFNRMLSGLIFLDCLFFYSYYCCFLDYCNNFFYFSISYFSLLISYYFFLSSSSLRRLV
jgi:hypothetical protein